MKDLVPLTLHKAALHENKATDLSTLNEATLQIERRIVPKRMKDMYHKVKKRHWGDLWSFEVSHESDKIEPSKHKLEFYE